MTKTEPDECAECNGAKIGNCAVRAYRNGKSCELLHNKKYQKFCESFITKPEKETEDGGL